MIVSTLSLSHFRNYEQVLIEPDEGVTVFTGPNAQGKTNILEALHVCCLGRSHRTARDEEMIQWGQENARILVRTRQADGTHEVSVLLSRTQKKKKTVRIGARQAERIGELLGHVCGVLFSPEVSSENWSMGHWKRKTSASITICRCMATTLPADWSDMPIAV